MVHRWLQRIAEDKAQGWNVERVKSLQSRVAQDIGMSGLPLSELQMAVDRVLSGLINTLDDPRGQWILGPHMESQSEHPVTSRRGTSIRRFVVDCYFREKDDSLSIVDYKTSHHEGSNVEAFLDRERDRYLVQFQAYSDVMSGGSANCSLYFPLHRGWRQWGEK